VNRALLVHCEKEPL